MIYIASDHGGFELKKLLVEYFRSKNVDIQDLGPHEYVPDDDYPNYTIPLIKHVLESQGNKGILICRNGVGVSMLANKFKGIRCALSWNIKHAISARNDDDTNVLALAADYTDPEEAKEIVKAWLATNASVEARHLRRLKKVSESGQEL